MKKIIVLFLALVMVFSLAACSKKNETEKSDGEQIEDGTTVDGEQQEDNTPVEDEQQDEQQDPELPADFDEEAYEALMAIDFLEEDNRYVFTINNLKQEFILDGDEIVKYMTYLDCEDEETAKSVAETYKFVMDSSEESDIKSVVCKGSIVISELSVESAPFSNREELKEMYDSYIELKDQLGN